MDNDDGVVILLVCLSHSHSSMCGLRWSRYWWPTEGSGERLSPVGSHSWPAGGYDGARKSRTGLL